MTREHWSITTENSGRERRIEVFIYDKVSHLRAATQRWCKENDRPMDTTTAFGIFHGEYDPDDPDNPHAGIIRLVRDELRPGIVSHEIAHAAQWLYWLDTIRDMPKKADDLAMARASKNKRAVDHMTGSNERFAYLYGALFEAMWEIVQKVEAQ